MHGVSNRYKYFLALVTASNFEKRLKMLQKYPKYVTIVAIIHILTSFFMEALLKLSEWVIPTVLIQLMKRKMTRTDPKDGHEFKKGRSEQKPNKEESNGSEHELQLLQDQIYEIISHIEPMEYQSSFWKFDVFLFNLAEKNVGEKKQNFRVDVCWASMMLQAGPFIFLFINILFFALDLQQSSTVVDLIIIVVYLLLTSRIIHVQGRQALLMDLSPLLLKLIRITRTVDELTITLANVSRIYDRLRLLSQHLTKQEIFIARNHLRDIFLSHKQHEGSSTSIIDNVEEWCLMLTKTYDVIKESHAKVTKKCHLNQEFTKICDLNDALEQILGNLLEFPKPLLQFLLTFYGMVDGFNYKFDDFGGHDLTLGVNLEKRRKLIRQKLTMQLLRTSLVAKTIPSSALRDNVQTSSLIEKCGLLLRTSPIFINLGNIGEEVFDICKNLNITPSFVFEQLKHQLMVINGIFATSSKY